MSSGERTISRGLSLIPALSRTQRCVTRKLFELLSSNKRCQQRGRFYLYGRFAKVEYMVWHAHSGKFKIDRSRFSIDNSTFSTATRHPAVTSRSIKNSLKYHCLRATGVLHVQPVQLHPPPPPPSWDHA